MKVSEWLGVYLRYKDCARPIETVERATYAFNNEQRECLVTEKRHIAILLATGKYEISAVEVGDMVGLSPIIAPVTITGGTDFTNSADLHDSETSGSFTPIASEKFQLKRRGRPPKGAR